MSDYPEITCSQCKDLAFARNLARQMKDGSYGRHNSNRRREANSPTPERLAESFRFHTSDFTEQAAQLRFRTRSEIGLESVLGRIGDGKIRTLMFQCAIGDAVICDDPDPPNKIFTYLAQRAPAEFHRLRALDC